MREIIINSRAQNRQLQQENERLRRETFQLKALLRRIRNEAPGALDELTTALIRDSLGEEVKA